MTVSSVGRIASWRIIPVVVVEDAGLGGGLRDAIRAGGIGCAEVTCRTEAALGAIERMAEDPEFVVGAGTVTTPEQVERTVAAGARFIVSPGLSEAVVRAAAEHDVPCIPGAVTASEIMRAIDLGIDTVKFFPAQASGGLPAITALAGPFPDIRFVPTGGIRIDSLPEYLASAAVAAVGGTWLTPASVLRSGDLSVVTELVQQAVGVAQGAA